MKLKLVLIVLLLMLFAPACGSNPVTPDVKDTQAGDGWVPDGTDMSCYQASDYIAMEICKELIGRSGPNGEEWYEWVHPYNPNVSAEYFWWYLKDWLLYQQGCDFVDQMVARVESEGYDFPNYGEVDDWPPWL